ncbi:hypothetical protein ACWEGM_16555, partial [Streptomyces nigra]
APPQLPCLVVRVVDGDPDAACTRAAEEAAAEVVGAWGEVLGEDGLRALLHALTRIAVRGPVRPSW